MALHSLLQRAGPQDAIVHIGPGVLYDEARYDRQKGRVFIYEPDPERARALGFLTAKNAKLRIIEAAASEEGERRLYKYNYPYLDALRRLHNADASFPGLRVEAEQDAPVVAVGDVLSALPEETAANDLLILDSLGEGLSLLQAFENAGGLARFSAIVLRSAQAENFPDDSVGAETEWLCQRGFHPPICIDDTHPEFPILFFVKNMLADEFDRKSVALVEMAEELEACRANLQDLKDEKRDLKDEKISLLQADLEDLRARYSRVATSSEESASLIAAAREILGRISQAVSALSAKEQEMISEAFNQAGVTVEGGANND